MKRFIVYFVLMIGVGLRAPAQDAGSLQLAPGMSAVTMRVMIESSDLDEIKAGDRIDLFQALPTGWDYEHADAFTDTYILVDFVGDVLVLGIAPPSGSLPIFCPTCESVSVWDFLNRHRAPEYYRRER